jgi:two-component system, response regulator
LSEVPSKELLLVEDDDNDIELTLRALKGVNLLNKIHVAKDGQAALDYVLGMDKNDEATLHSFPLAVLLDLKLPKINGLEVLKKLKSDPLTANIPVIMLTASKESSDLKKCYDLGANSYIVKPYDLQDFTRAVSSAALYWLLINESSTGK